MEKSKVSIDYRLQFTTTPDGQTCLVPAITDRRASLDLSDVVKDAILCGRVAALKNEAVEPIALAIAEEIYAALQQGDSVNFDGYFYGRLYLDGTVNADGRITSENSINIRLVKGAKWALATNDFSFTNIADDKTMQEFRTKLENDFSFMSYVPFVFISAKTGQRISRPKTSRRYSKADGRILALPSFTTKEVPNEHYMTLQEKLAMRIAEEKAQGGSAESQVSPTDTSGGQHADDLSGLEPRERLRRMMGGGSDSLPDLGAPFRVGQSVIGRPGKPGR